MKILLTNDDGICGEGLRTLASALKKAGHDVFVCAPHENNSAVSHKLTMREKLQLSREDFDGIPAYAVSGTPTDCVLVAVNHLNFSPDLIISGINAGLNLGIDTLYSGTVAGATEGALAGIPSLALSQRLRGRCDADVFARAAMLTCSHLEEWLALAKEAGAVNINFPDGIEKGIKFCRVMKSKYRTRYEETAEGLRFLECVPEYDGEGDVSLLLDGYITVSPLRCDMTNDEILARWRGEDA